MVYKSQKQLTAIGWADSDSSNISATFFHEPSQTLCVRFKNGGLYSYMAPLDIYMGLVHAESMGKYLHNVVKSYPYTRWESEDSLLAYLNNV